MGSSQSTLGRDFLEKSRPSSAPAPATRSGNDDKPKVLRRLSAVVRRRDLKKGSRLDALKHTPAIDPRRDSALTQSEISTTATSEPPSSQTVQETDAIQETHTDQQRDITDQAHEDSQTTLQEEIKAETCEEALEAQLPPKIEIEALEEDLSTSLDATQTMLSNQIRSRYNNPEIIIYEEDSVDPSNIDRYGFLIGGSKLRTSNESRKSLPPINEDLLQPVQRTRNRLHKPSRRSLRQPESIMSKAQSTRSIRSVRSVRSIRSVRSYTYLHLPNKHEERVIHKAGSMLFTPHGLDDTNQTSHIGKSSAQLSQKERQREYKWQSMGILSSTHNDGRGMDVFFNPQNPKTVERTWKGIPDRWRATAWFSFLHACAKKDPSSLPVDSLISKFFEFQEQPCADDPQIDVDVPRTINDHVLFRGRYSSGQRLLFRVLHAITLYLPETGYVQGMAAIAATLLCYFTEERAFVVLVWLFRYRSLAYLYQPGFTGLMTCLKNFDDTYLAKKPQIAQKLEDLGITTMTFGTKWYLTLFNYSLPFPSQLRVWDVLMMSGPNHMEVLHATSAALIDASREVLENADFENAMKTLTSFVPVQDEDILMKTVHAEFKLRMKKR